MSNEITISQVAYEGLVRDSQNLEILRAAYHNGVYGMHNDILKAVFGEKEKEEAAPWDEPCEPLPQNANIQEGAAEQC